MGTRHRPLLTRRYHGTHGRPPNRLEAMAPWSPVLLGVGILVSYLIYALVLSAGPPLPPLVVTDSGFVRGSPAPSPSGTTSSQGGDAGPASRPVRNAAPVERSPTPEPSPTPSPTETGPPANLAELVGQYRIDASWSDAFAGQVVIFNRSHRRAGDWVVELTFGSGVGELNRHWVDGTPQPTVSRSGDRYVFTGTVPVEPRSWVVLRFHFDRTGRDIAPTSCAVNGTSCDIRDDRHRRR